MPRYALRLRYDGSAFAGWAVQAGRRTAGGEVLAALARLGETPDRLHGASRLDAGVHALAQVAHVDLARAWPADALAHALDHHLPPDLACTGVAAVGPDFDACRDPLGKTYRYRLDTGRLRDPLRHRSHWRPPLPLDDGLLAAGARLLAGCHDFAAFARSDDHREDFTCTLDAVAWDGLGDERTCHVAGDRFPYHLVRSLVGAMVSVAAGQHHLDDLAAAVAGRCGGVAAQVAPAGGLALALVRYPREPAWTLPE